MTPDESAWTQFITELQRLSLPDTASAAAAALAELRKRRESGAFGPAPMKPLCTQGHLYVDDCERAGHAVLVEASTTGAEKHDATRGILSIRNLVNEALIQRGLGRPERTVELLHAALKAMDGMMGTSYPIADGEPYPSTTDAGAEETHVDHQALWMRAERERDEARIGLDQQTKRAFAAEQERDAVRRDALNFLEQRDANLALLQAARARAETAEREIAKLVTAFRDEFAEAGRWGDARNLTPAETAVEWMRKGQEARALLKEALGPLAVVANMPTQPLNGLVYVVDPVTRGQATDVLSRAKAAGYEP